MHKLSEDKTQITFTVGSFDYGYADSMSATVDLEFKMPFEYEVRLQVEMEEDHLPFGERRMPYEVLEEFIGKKVEITCDIDPEWGSMTSKPSMIKIIG